MYITEMLKMDSACGQDTEGYLVQILGLREVKGVFLEK
jgi:hypothetical protein